MRTGTLSLLARTIRTLIVLTVVAAGFGQDGGVVILGEDDFEEAPDAAPVGNSGVQSPQLATSGAGTGEIHRFDPRRNAQADIRNALAVASRESKHVLLEVGGNWCPFCKVLDTFFIANPQILALRKQHFVYVKVNFSDENKNEAALEPYPLIRGFPHFYVLDATGKLLRSQRVALLGTQSGYSAERFQRFFELMAPGKR